MQLLAHSFGLEGVLAFPVRAQQLHCCPGQLVVGRDAPVAARPAVGVHDDECVHDVVRP